jgi:hypothetical protein
VPEKAVNEGTGEMAWRWMDNNPWRLVHHDQPWIFVDDFKGHCLWIKTERFGGRQRYLDLVAGFQTVTGLRAVVIDTDKAGLDQLLDSGSRQVLHPQNQKGIQASGFVHLVDGKPMPAGFFLHHLKTR